MKWLIAVLLVLFCASQASAAWGIRGGCSSCQSGTVQAEKPVVTNMPDQGICTKGVCPLATAVKSAANVTKDAVQDVAIGVKRVVTYKGPVRRWIAQRRGF